MLGYLDNVLFVFINNCLYCNSNLQNGFVHGKPSSFADSNSNYNSNIIFAL